MAQLEETTQRIISIHAPHEGCDPVLSSAGGGGGEFQSTHPMRGATPVSQSWSVRLDFNPRTP